MNGFRRPDIGDSVAPEGLIDLVHERLACKDPLTKKLIGVMMVAICIFDYKQQNYGPANIAAFGEFGITVRLHDKLARLINLQKKGSEPQDETRDDSWGDSLVYSAIALMCRWGWWPGVVPAPQYADPPSARVVDAAIAIASHHDGCILRPAHDGDCIQPRQHDARETREGCI